ncbi:MAG: ATP-binding protein [Nanoarchaeota archaeon]
MSAPSGQDLEQRVQEDEKDRLVVSYRTMGAAVALIAHVRPVLLNNLFDGVRMPREGFDKTIFIPPELQSVLTAQGREGYCHFLAHPDDWARLSDQRRLLENLVKGTGDEASPYDMGRNVRQQREFETIKNVFMLFGINPNVALKRGLAKTNRRFNRFLTMDWVGGGKNYVEIRIQYFNSENVHPRGDLYSLGVLTAGIESFIPNAEVHIEALISPFDLSLEQRKVSYLNNPQKRPRVSYSCRQCDYQPGTGTYLYRFTWRKKAMSWMEQLSERWGTFLLNYSRRRDPSYGSLREWEEAKIAERITQEMELKENAQRERLQALLKEADARREAAEAQQREAEGRASILEARLILERQVSGANEVFGQIATLAHHNKNLAVIQLDRTVHLLEEILTHYPEYKPTLPVGIFQLNGLFLSTVDQVIAAPASPEIVRSAAIYVREALPRLKELIDNERKMMQGGSPIDIKECRYAEIMEYVISQVQPTHPAVAIQWKKRDFAVHVDQYLLQTALLNLVSNAVEASEPKGMVEIQERQVECGPEAGGRIITIIDLLQTGYLAEEHADKLNHLEKFTTKESGNGTGAVASYRIISAHNNGTIVYTPLGTDLRTDLITDQKTAKTDSGTDRYRARIRVTFGFVPPEQ